MLDWVKEIIGDGYTDELDEKVRAVLGKQYIPRAEFNEKNESVKALSAQLADRDKQLEELGKAKGKDKDNLEDLQKEIQGLILKNKEQEDAYKAKLEDLEFSTLLEDELGKNKAKNVKAVKALLDIDGLKASKNRATDIKTAVDGIREKNEFLFESDEPVKNPVAPSGDEPTNALSDSILRSVMGFKSKEEK